MLVNRWLLIDSRHLSDLQFVQTRGEIRFQLAFLSQVGIGLFVASQHAASDCRRYLQFQWGFGDWGVFVRAISLGGRLSSSLLCVSG